MDIRRYINMGLAEIKETTRKSKTETEVKNKKEQLDSILDIFTPIRDERIENKKEEKIDRIVDEMSEEKIKEIGNDFWNSIPTDLHPIEEHFTSINKQLTKLKFSLARKYKLDEKVLSAVVNRFLNLYVVQTFEILGLNQEDISQESEYHQIRCRQRTEIYGEFNGELGRFLLYIRLIGSAIILENLEEMRKFQKHKLATRQIRDYMGKLQYKGQDEKNDTFKEYIEIMNVLDLFTASYEMGEYKRKTIPEESIMTIGIEFWESIQGILDKVENINDLKKEFQILKTRLAHQYQVGEEFVTASIYRYLQNQAKYQKQVEEQDSVYNEREYIEFISNWLTNRKKTFQRLPNSLDKISEDIKQEIYFEFKEQKYEQLDIKEKTSDLIKKQAVIIKELAKKHKIKEMDVEAIINERNIEKLESSLEKGRKKSEEMEKRDEQLQDVKDERRYLLTKNLIFNACDGDIARARLYARLINYTLDEQAIDEAKRKALSETQDISREGKNKE